MKLYCTVTEYGLTPYDDNDLQLFRRLKRGAVVKVETRAPRNLRFHRKFFALLRVTFDNLPEYVSASMHIESIEAMLMLLKMDMGCYDVVEIGEHRFIKPHSISFAEMDETEFSEFYNKALTCILNNYLTLSSPAELEEAVRDAEGKPITKQ